MLIDPHTAVAVAAARAEIAADARRRADGRAGLRASGQISRRGRARHRHSPGSAAGARRSFRAARADRRPAERYRRGERGSSALVRGGWEPQHDSCGFPRLANGLRVATDRIDTVDTVSLGIWVDVGTRHEPAEINGVAHFLEHMAFKGTERRSARAIAEEIEAVGGHLNAYTSRESTAYYAKVLKEDVPLALDILADILQHSTFDPEELERERTVILQEIGQANDTPDDIIFDHFQERAYPDQAMGRPVLGQPGNHPRAAAGMRWSRYLRDHYGAQRMVLAAAGNLEHERLARPRRQAAFGACRPSAPSAPSRHVIPAAIGARTAISSSCTSFSAFPAWCSSDPDYYAASVLSTAFGGGMSSRLFQEIREKRGLVYAIHSFAHGYRDGGLFGIYAGTGEDEAAELVPALCEEASELQDGLTRDRAQPRQGADEGGSPDVAREHLGALRAAGAAPADLRHTVRSAGDRAAHRGGR